MPSDEGLAVDSSDYLAYGWEREMSQRQADDVSHMGIVILVVFTWSSHHALLSGKLEAQT